MKCFVKLPHLRSNLGDVYLCHQAGRVFVSHMNNRVVLNDVTWNSEDVPEEYQEFIVASGLPD